MTEQGSHQGFLLSRSYRDGRAGLELEMWGKGDDLPLLIRLHRQEAVLFVERHQAARAARRASVELLSLWGRPVDALYFERQRDLVAERSALRERGIFPFESDIKPVERFLMERFVLGSFTATGPSTVQNGVRVFREPRIQASDYQPQLSALSLDIETVGLTGKLLSLAGIFRPARRSSDAVSAAPNQQQAARVFLVEQPGTARLAARPAEVLVCPDERTALLEFCRWVCQVDPDLLLGWNVIDFDLDYLAKLAGRLRVPLTLGRAGGRLEVLQPRSESQPRVARVPGRVVLDGIATLRNATIFLESYALDDVARELLGKGKAIAETTDKVREIERMANEDPLALALYNLQDCQLVLDIFDRARLFDFVIERQRLTGLAMDRQGGSVAAFDQLYLPRLHRAGFVAPSVGDRTQGPSSPGGYVLDSVPGLHHNVIVLDFKSLYPSIIRTFLVDPLGLALAGRAGLGRDALGREGMAASKSRTHEEGGAARGASVTSRTVPGYDGAEFAREGHILPGLIETLWAARDRAKAQENTAMSQAIKIMMNSFYGVLGTPGCRFFDHRLVSSITKRGHEIILLAREQIEKHGKQVIYGDTDSLFVLVDSELDDRKCDAIGRQFASELTSYFRAWLREQFDLESHLELEYEKHYRRFFMPTMRGSERGTKKRYVGATWTDQGEMQLVFKGMEAVRTDWTPLARGFQRELYRRIFANETYEDYVRSVVKDLMSGALDEQLVYQKRIRRPLAEYVTNVPPHVQAARKLSNPTRRVRYVITVNGPEPIENRVSRIEHEHYLLRQLAPAAEGILHAIGADFSELAGTQLRLF